MYLSVIGIFKNESWIIQEWLEHYLAEGVEHFYLIDNGSIDKVNQVLDRYIKEGLVTLRRDDRPHMQTEHYNNFLPQVKLESEWVMIVDFDEFIYSRPPFSTISAYLKSVPPTTGQVYVPWKLFGSAGLVQQPPNCLDHFVHRTKYSGVKTNGMSDNEHMLTKTVMRTKNVTHLGIHCSDVAGASETTSDGKPITGQKCYQAVSEDILRQSKLHCNHYPIQSFEWFRQVKMTRGSANSIRSDNVRTPDYYNSFDSHSAQVQDNELSEKRMKFRAYYGVGQTYRDVTRYILKSFTKPDGKIEIPGWIIFNNVFGDPVEGQEKFLVVQQGYRLSVYPENNHPTLCFMT